jgi:predicted N-acetyltransferase YhbS
MTAPSHSRPYVLRKLDKKDDRTAFSCGNDDLDRYFRLYAAQHQFRQFLGTTYVAVTPEDVILGFVAVTAGSIAPADLSAWKKSLPDLPLPVIRLSRLGVSVAAQGLGIGNALVALVCKLALEQAGSSGCVGVVVDAKPKAVGYYERLGFFRMTIEQGELGDRPQTVPMVLPLKSIRT